MTKTVDGDPELDNKKFSDDKKSKFDFKFLKRNFKGPILGPCNILNQLELDQSIRSRHLDHDISSITDFKLRIGRKARVFYINETGIEKNLLEKSFFVLGVLMIH
jgi:hypothetical protein